MGTIFSYSLVSAIMLGCLYPAYRWTMANERQFSLNRITLYLIYTLSFIAPFLYNLISHALSSTHIPVSHVVWLDFTNVASGIVEETETMWMKIILWVYIGGIFITTIRLIASLIRLCYIIRTGTYLTNYESYPIVITTHSNLSPFSFFRYMIISEKDYCLNNHIIITHELTHLRSKHWIDLIIANLVTIFQWYNPISWLMIEEFKTIHEYQADDSVICSGTDIKDYQYLLIEKAIGERLPSPANSLNHSKLKKRVTMMYKTKPGTLRRVASIATIPALVTGVILVNTPVVGAVLSEVRNTTIFTQGATGSQIFTENQEKMAETFDKVTTFSADTENNVSEKISLLNQTEKVITNENAANNNKNAAVQFSVTASDTEVSAVPSETVASISLQNDDSEDRTYLAAEQLAEFPGGQSELIKFMLKHIQYPEKAFKNNIQGRVIVKFTIAKNGKIESPTVVRGVDPELDEEAIRVVKEMPNWIPAKVNNKPVASWFTIPVSFKLEEPDNSENSVNQE